MSDPVAVGFWFVFDRLRIWPITERTRERVRKSGEGLFKALTWILSTNFSWFLTNFCYSCSFVFCRCTEIFLPSAYSQRTHSPDTEHFNRSKTQPGILVLNEVAKWNNRTTRHSPKRQHGLWRIFHSVQFLKKVSLWKCNLFKLGLLIKKYL